MPPDSVVIFRWMWVLVIILEVLVAILTAATVTWVLRALHA